MNIFYLNCFYFLIFLIRHGECLKAMPNNAKEEVNKEEVDKVIENEITQRLSDDLLQSIEKKFYVDLEKSVDMVLMKIKLLLQNGTTHIQERLEDLEGQLGAMKKDGESVVNKCLSEQGNVTVALAEKALHQMVVCGYALIGHDPAQAVKSVMMLKNMIKEGMQPILKQKDEVYRLLKVCGHDHDSLKKVIKCVISKSPKIKSTMMEITNKLISGVVDLTKLMAHGAMHEACLIEVIKSVEDEAFQIVKDVKKCFNNDKTIKYQIKDIEHDTTLSTKKDEYFKNNDTEKEMKEIIKKMLTEPSPVEHEKYKEKILTLQKDIGTAKSNANNIDGAKDDK